MSEQISVMLDYQDAMNCRVHNDWREQRFPWCRAIWIECAELIDHYGWKWWKKQSPDTEQVKLELIDIWHFGLSHLMMSDTDADTIAQALSDGIEHPAEDFLAIIELFVQDTLTHQQFDPLLFGQAMGAISFTFDELFIGYMGKNVLNFFRQDNGYKEGHYQKNWDGREDNEHLVEIVATLDSSDSEFKHILYQALAKRYTEIAAK
ncbi:dUTP diphosphatase [bacterium]|nr:dUTP diphosphatase [bacterium]